MHKSEITDPDPSEPDAEQIVYAAEMRGMGDRPRLRFAAAVVWSAFLGAVVSLLFWLLAPEDWLDPPVGFDRLAVSFLALWALALIPATVSALLCLPRNPVDEDHAR